MLCSLILTNASETQQAIGKTSLYDNLIYSSPTRSNRGGVEGGTSELGKDRTVIKPSATMLSGTVDDMNYHLELANIAMLQGRNLDAGWHYFYVTQNNPEVVFAQEGLALSVAKTGNVPTAHKIFRRLYEQNPMEVRCRIQLAASEFHMGEYEKSLLHLKFPPGVPESYDSLYLRGLCYYATGKVREAIESLQAAHDQELERPDPIKAMVEIFASRGMKEPVEALLKKLEVLADPDDYSDFRKQPLFNFLAEE